MKTNRVLFWFGLLGATVRLAVAQPADIRQGLVAYWPLDATDGVITADATPLQNNLTLVAMDPSSFVPGEFGNAGSFNGSSSYLTNLHSSDNAVTGLPVYRAGSYTIAMWVKGAAQTAKYLFTEASTASTAPLLLLQTGQLATNNTKFDVNIRTDGNVTLLNHVVSTNVVFDGNWHHIAWVDDSGQARLYVDGNLDPANFNYTPSGTFTLNTTAIGTLVRATISTGAIFNGLIDDVAVWERPLSQAEVQQVMTSSLATPIPVLPPVFITQPRSSTNALGDRVRLTGRAVGGRPLSYQWYKGDVEVFGAVSNALTLSGLTVADSGDYTLVANASSGSTTSLVATLTVLPDPTPNVRQGLVSYWPMNDIVEDSALIPPFSTPDFYSSNTMNLVTAGFFDKDFGMFGDAIAFNLFSQDQYGVRNGGFPIYNNPAHSVALWVRANGTNQADARFFAESSTNSPNPLFAFGTQVAGTNGSVRVYIRNDAGAVLLDRTSARTALDDTWHHVVWTDNNGHGKLYIDGVLDDNDYQYTRSTLTLDQTALAAIRRATVASFLKGSLDEVAVWNRVLSLTEIHDIRDNGIPLPVGFVPPSIAQHPVSQSVLTRTKVTFSFTATGTSPLNAQWRKNGTDLPLATAFVLTLPGVTLDDAGDYEVIISNAGGSATSLVATLTVALRPPPPTDLKIDFNNIGAETPADTEAGFLSFALPQNGVGPFTRSFGGADVTLSAIGTTMESRLRTTPSNAVDFTEEKLLRDFIFTRDAADGQGLDVAVQFLEPNQPFTVTVWSFDSSSVGNNRISDWSANGAQVLSAYSFIGSDLPTANDRYRFSFDATSDADGAILVQGRRNSSAAGAINVFLNALQVSKRELRVLRIDVAEFGDLRLTIQALNPAATHRIVEKASLTDADWTEVPGVNFGAPNGNVLQATFAPPVGQTRFYRVVENP